MTPAEQLAASLEPVLGPASSVGSVLILVLVVAGLLVLLARGTHRGLRHLARHHARALAGVLLLALGVYAASTQSPLPAWLLINAGLLLITAGFILQWVTRRRHSREDTR